VLKNEKAVVIFPESSVNQEDGVKSYKSGFVLMSLMSKKPILPVCIIKRKRWYHRLKIVIGEPIDASSMCSAIPTVEEMDRVSELINQKEQEMLLTYKEN
jgi:1-acyl-sn-glycerol-3-phosphate acyltransferase